MSTSASKRRKIQKRSVGTLLRTLADKNKFSYLDSLPTVTQEDIYVDHYEEKSKDPKVMRKDQFTTAITQSACVQSSSVPLELVDIIADYGYIIPMLQEELARQLPLLPDRSMFEDDNTLIKLDKLTGLDIIQRWVPSYTPQNLLYDRAILSVKMESTLDRVIAILREKCWTVQIYYKKKKYDETHVVCMLLTGVARQRSHNHVYIFRVYVSRADGPIDFEERIDTGITIKEIKKLLNKQHYSDYDPY